MSGWVVVLMEPLNPVEIESKIRELSNRIAKGVKVASDLYSEFLAADRVFDAEFARAYLGAEGSIKDKEQSARLESMPEREARDVADAAYRYADRLAKALELELRALQSIGASVRAMYGVAGRGEGA